MRPRFPLYARILLWFFLNLLVVGVVLAIAFGAQFRLGLDWIMAGETADRIEAVSYLIATEFSERPRSEWTSVLERFGSAYGVGFLAFDHDGIQLAGAAAQLPPEVKARVMRLHRLKPHPFRPHPPQAPGAGLRAPPDPQGTEPPPIPRPPMAPLHAEAGGRRFAKAIVRTSNPTRYWIVVDLQLPPAEGREPRPVTVLAVSNSLSGGGLLFDMRPWLTAGAAVLLVSGLLWFPFVRGITRSIRQMTEATTQIAHGRFDVRVSAERRDELGQLSGSINQMAERLFGFVTGQKRFLGDIAHELCAPLARLQVALGILEQRANDAQKPYVNTACGKAEEVAALVNELLSFSKASLMPAKLALVPVSVADAVQKAVGREADDKARLEVELPAELRVRAEPELLVRALSNLVRNALLYAGAAGPVRISAQLKGKDVLLSVADSGPGIPPEHLDKVFDPFYRVDTSRDRATGGVGLGLTIVRTCIEACDGQVSCRNRDPHGLEVTLRLRGAD